MQFEECVTLFISYASDDEAEFENLVEFMRSRGIPVWADRMGVRAGRNLRDQIRQGVSECGVAVLIASSASLASDWCMAEVGAFWGQGKPVIVYRSAGVEHGGLPEQLRADRSTDRLKEVAEAVEAELSGATDLSQRARPATIEDVERVIHAAIAPLVGGMSNGPSGQGTLERIPSQTGLRDLSLLKTMLKRTRAVARVGVRGPDDSISGYGTGFLVAPGLLLTANHLVDGARFRGANLLFDFEADEAGMLQRGIPFEIPSDHLVAWDRDLDYALLRVRDADLAATLEFGHLLAGSPPEPGDTLVAFFHREGAEKAVTLFELLTVEQERVTYRWGGTPGSSGAPLLDMGGLAVAVHHLAVVRRDAEGRPLARDGTVWQADREPPEPVDFVAGEGTRLDLILQHATAALTSRGGEIAARVRVWAGEPA